MKDISKAADALRSKRLDALVRTVDYGVLSWREYVERRIAAGGRVLSTEVPDANLRRKLQEEYDRMNQGFNVPWGNERHPKTIAAQALKDRLNGYITSTQYRMYGPSGDNFTVITKTVYEYGLSLMGRVYA